MIYVLIILGIATKNPGFFLIAWICYITSGSSKKSGNHISKPPVGENIKDSDETNSEDENK